MGVLTDFFVAHENEITGEIVEAGPSGRFETFEAKGVDTVQVATLTGITLGRDYSLEGGFDALHGELDATLRMAGDEGPWLCRIPNELTRALADVDDARLDEIAREWAQTDEWSMFRDDPAETLSDARWVAGGIRDLARAATAAGKGVYLWISL